MQAQFMLNFPSVGQKALSEFVYLNLCYSKDPTNGELWSVCDLIVRSGVFILLKLPGEDWLCIMKT